MTWAKDDRGFVDRLLARALGPALLPSVCRSIAAFGTPAVAATLAERIDWRERVERVRSQILCGALKKVVLSRRLAIETGSPIDPARFIDSARAARPSCVNFFVGAGSTSFVGFHAGTLVELDGETVTSSALAGSVARGGNDQEDRALGDSLLSSAKNLEEHPVRRQCARVGARARGFAVERSRTAAPDALARGATSVHPDRGPLA